MAAQHPLKIKLLFAHSQSVCSNDDRGQWHLEVHYDPYQVLGDVATWQGCVNRFSSLALFCSAKSEVLEFLNNSAKIRLDVHFLYFTRYP